jgi:hypothetical protein
MVQETYPTSYYCYKCGDRRYPGFVKRIGKTADVHRERQMTQSAKEVQYRRVKGLIEWGLTGTEIYEEMSSYSRTMIDRCVTRARKELDLG